MLPFAISAIVAGLVIVPVLGLSGTNRPVHDIPHLEGSNSALLRRRNLGDQLMEPELVARSKNRVIIPQVRENISAFLATMKHPDSKDITDYLSSAKFFDNNFHSTVRAAFPTQPVPGVPVFEAQKRFVVESINSVRRGQKLADHPTHLAIARLNAAGLWHDSHHEFMPLDSGLKDILLQHAKNEGDQQGASFEGFVRAHHPRPFHDAVIAGFQKGGIQGGQDVAIAYHNDWKEGKLGLPLKPEHQDILRTYAAHLPVESERKEAFDAYVQKPQVKELHDNVESHLVQGNVPAAHQAVVLHQVFWDWFNQIPPDATTSS